MTTLLIGIGIGAIGGIVIGFKLDAILTDKEWWDRPPGKIVSKLMEWGIVK